jgi:uncharacterized protein (TIGR00252 family)
MSTTSTGRQAEKVAGEYLKKLGYKILTFNWRTRWCEVDVVAAKNGVVFFVEVKYRAHSDWGDGLEVITNKKLQQMEFAAQMWIDQNNWDGDYRLAAVSVGDEPVKVLDFIEL